MKIRHIHHFEENGPEPLQWNDLVLRTKSTNVFLTYEWLSAWWDVFGKDKELLVLIAEEDGDANRASGGFAGIAPLYREKGRLFDLFPLRQIRFLGDTAVGSDFLDFIVSEGREAEVISLFLDYLLHHFTWERLCLDDMADTSPTIALLASLAAQRKLRLTVHKRFPCPSMAIPQSMDELMAVENVTFKKITKGKSVKTLYRKHRVEFIYETGCKELGWHLEQFFSIHNDRWEGEHTHRLFDSQDMREFYKRVSLAFCEKGWLKLSALAVDGKIEAMDYGIVYDKTYSLLQTGCTKWGLSVRAGNVIMYRLFEHLVGKVGTFHFLRGDEPYKYGWGGVDRMTLSVQLWRGVAGSLLSTLNSSLLAGKKFIKKTLKGLKKT